MNTYNSKLAAERQKRKAKLLEMKKRMTVKEMAIRLRITHQAIYKAMK